MHYRADVPFLIPPVRGFVPWPSRKWELGRQQLTKELWRIQLAINGQPQAFVPVAMATAQHHYSKITKPFSTLLLLFPPSPLFAFSPCPFYSFKVMSLFFLFGSSEQGFFSLFPVHADQTIMCSSIHKSTWFMFSVEQQLSLSCGFFNFPWLSAWRFKHNRNLCTVSNKILTAWYQRGALSNFLLAVPHSDVKYNTAVLLPAVKPAVPSRQQEM